MGYTHLKLKDQKAIVRSLKTGRLMGGGQTLKTLANVPKPKLWTYEVSRFMQYLKKYGRVTYFKSSRVWYWIDEVEFDDIIKPKKVTL